MLENERLEKIMFFLRKKKTASNKELCESLFCSPSTLRRDLLRLEAQGLIKRNHGTVRLIPNTNNEFSYLLRETECKSEKEYIANIASKFITDGNALFLDASSSVNKICSHLENLNLYVVTNCLKNAIALSLYENIKVFTPAGEIKNNSTSIVGAMVGDFLSHFQADIALISCRGIDESNLYEADINQALVKQQVIKNAKKTILFCDDTKFGSTHFFKLATFEEIDILITNEKPDAHYIEKITEKGCQVIYSLENTQITLS